MYSFSKRWMLLYWHFFLNCNTAQYNAIQFKSKQSNYATQQNETKHNWRSMHNTTRQDMYTTRHDTTRHNTTQHNTTRHNTTLTLTQQDTTQHSMTRLKKKYCIICDDWFLRNVLVWMWSCTYWFPAVCYSNYPRWRQSCFPCRSSDPSGLQVAYYCCLTCVIEILSCQKLSSSFSACLYYTLWLWALLVSLNI